MRTAKQFVTVMAAVLLAHAWFSPNIANAGPIYEWWQARRAARQQPPVIAYQSPVVSMQSCCDVSACNSCNTCSTCDTGCNSCGVGSGQAVYGQPAYGQPTVANYAPTAVTAYAPQTGLRGFFRRYRTAWTQVPVTSYRPALSVDPNTGMTVTVLQPCTTYTWQLARVPVSTLRPSTYAVAYSQQAAAVSTGYASSGYYGATTVSAGAVGTGCSSCAAGGQSSISYGSPSYASPTYAAPTYAGPSTGTPTYAAPPATTAPALPAGPARSVGPAETAPADRAPSLSPNQFNQGASLRTPSIIKSLIPDRSAQGVQPQPKFEIGAGIKPVPDPYAPAFRAKQTSEQNDGDAVELHNPRDRTAAAPRQRTWAFQPVSWSRETTAEPVTAAVHETPARRPVVEEPTTVADSQQWDASGWTSVRN